MLSVGLCLSARLPAGLLVFLGFVSSFGSIDHRLQQFELLPCGAVQTVDFFDHIVGVGGCRPVFRVRPIPLSFWGNVPPLQWGHSFAWLTHLRLHRYHLIFTGYWLSAIRCGFRSERSEPDRPAKPYQCGAFQPCWHIIIWKYLKLHIQFSRSARLRLPLPFGGGPLP